MAILLTRFTMGTTMKFTMETMETIEKPLL